MKKTMKRLTCTALTALMLLSLSSCGGGTDSSSGDTQETKTLVLTCTALDPAEVTAFNSWGPAKVAC